MEKNCQAGAIEFCTNTNIVPFVDVSTYGGPLSYDSVWSAEEYAIMEDGGVVCSDYDFDKFKRMVVRRFNNLMANIIGDFLPGMGIVSVEATHMGSPREYNFISDWIDFTVKAGPDFIDKAEKIIFDPQNKKAIEEYIDRNWKSYDGFLSFMPYSLDDMRDVLSDARTGEGDHITWGAILSMLLVAEGEKRVGDITWGKNYWTESLVDDIRSNECLGDFCTVLDEYEIKEKFGSVAFFKEIEAARSRIMSDLDKYRASGVSSEAVDRADEEVRVKLQKLRAYEEGLRIEIGDNYPDMSAVINCISGLREDFDNEFGVIV